MKTKITYLTMALVIALSMAVGGLLVAPTPVEASVVTNVWVQFTTSTYNKTDTATDFSIHFTPTTAMKRGIDTITVWFPDGSTAMGPDNFNLTSAVATATYYSVDRDAEASTYSAVDITSNATLSTSGYRVTVKTPVDLDAGVEATFRIEAAATIKCADLTSGAHHDPYYVKLYTSKDTTPVLSDAFNIDATGIVATTLTLSPTTAGSAGQYKFLLNTSTSSAVLTAGEDTVTVIFPYGTTIPASIAADQVSWMNDGSSWSTGTVLPSINQKARTITVTTPILLSDHATNNYVKFSTGANIVNPTTAKTYTGYYVLTNEDELQVAEGGQAITAGAATKLGFNNDTYNSGSISDDATMINMYSSCLWVETQDTYGNLKDPDTEPTVTFSSDKSGTFHYNSDGDGTGDGTFTQDNTIQTSDGKVYAYFLPAASGTHTITAEAGGYENGTWTMYVAPGAELYDSNNNLINTYEPLSTAPASETSVSYAGSAEKHGGTYVQDALNASVTGDTVKLGGSSGNTAIYEVDTLLTLAQKITLTSASSATYTKLRPTSDNIHAINVTGDGTSAYPITISYLTFDRLVRTAGTNYNFDSGVYNNGYDYVTVDNNVFNYVIPNENHTAEAVVWFRTMAGAITSATISNNTFNNCGPWDYTGGSGRAAVIAAITESTSNAFSGLTISGNTLTDSHEYGIVLQGITSYGVSASITNNTITRGSSSLNLSDFMTSVSITGNTITEAYSYGIKVEGTNNTSITIKNNTISNSAGDYDVRMGEDTAGVMTFQYNDITGTKAGSNAIQADSGSATLDCKYNWYGNASGPNYTALTGATVGKSNPSGAGGKITDRVTYYPWLHTSKATVVSDNASYQTSTVDLVAGWNTLSTPVELIPTGDTIGELIPTGLLLCYTYSGGWVSQTTAYELSPCDAVYVKLSIAKTVQLKFDADEYTTPTKALAAGWNMAGLAYLSSSGQEADEAMGSVYKTPANLPGYSQVVSPSLNAVRRDMYYNQGTAWVVSSADHGGTTSSMYATYGYWVYMQNAATYAAGTITPIAPDLD